MYRIGWLLAVACGGSPSKPVVAPALEAVGDDCEQLLGERPDYRVCTSGDRIVEWIKEGDAWKRGTSIPRGRVRDQLKELVLVGGDCETADESPVPSSFCLFGRWHDWKSTRKSYALPQSLPTSDAFPRVVLLAPNGRLIAFTGTHVGAVGLHGEDWKITPVEATVEPDCGKGTPAKPFARSPDSSFRYTFALGFACKSRPLAIAGEVNLMEDANQVRIYWKPVTP